MSALRVKHDGDKQRRSGAYIGFSGYASILACTKTPVTDVQVAEITGIGQPCVRRLLKQFHALRLIHRVGWELPKHGFDKPIYALGPGEDVPTRMAANGKPMPHADFRPRLQERVVAFASVIHALDQPMTLAELEAQSGVFGSRLSELTRHLMRPEVRLIRICAWQRRQAPGGRPVRVLEYGPDQRDAPRPRLIKSKAARDRARRHILRPHWDQMVMTLKREAGFPRARA